MGSYTTTAADVTAGSLTNSATASASFGTQTVTSTAATVTVALSAPPIAVTIQYDYDDLYRLTAADYSNDDYYHYTYDAVGNRKTQERSLSGLVTNDTYEYDDANRLTSVNGVTYTWDNNGNLLNDGVNAYTYDAANRLETMTSSSVAASYVYNGMGDRLQETVNGSTTTFTMDLNTGLTQALSDGTNTYIYGNERLAQMNTGTEYFLGDALGSVRQLTNATGAVSYASAYDPYGVATQAYGTSQTAYGYTNEYADSYIKLIYLRSRWYDPASGRLLTRDSWQGDYNRPLSLNRWMYTEGNPVNYTDPTGNITEQEAGMANFFVDLLRNDYNVKIEKDWGYPVTRMPPSSLQPFVVTGILFQCGDWEKGNWRSIHEIKLVYDGVEAMSKKLGGVANFRAALQWSPITIRRMANDYHNDDGGTVGWTVLDVKLYNGAFNGTDVFASGTVVHELAHVWDIRQWFQPSYGMMYKTGSYRKVCSETPSGKKEGCITVYDASMANEEAPDDYAKGTVFDDFAESFAICVYPNFKGVPSLNRYPIRKSYIEGLLNGNKCSQ